MRSTIAATLVLCAAEAAAQPQPPQPDPAPAETPPPEPTPSHPDDGRLRALESENQELRDRLEALEDDHKFLEEKVEKLAPVAAKVTGFLDVGFFSVQGDGSGIRSDIGYVHFPEYDQGSSGIPDSWVFMGDPLSVMVNSRGDPATTGESRAITFDGIGAHKSTFLINSLNVGLFSEVGANAIFTAKADLLPRGRDVSNPDGLFLGDYVDVRLAYLEYRLGSDRVKASLFAGKFDSLVGFEYRSQEAPTRIEVTPSLICRYTCGYPIGVKARVVFGGALTFAGGVSNGSNFSEGFAFYNEIDANEFKTLSGRLSYEFVKGLELGTSGMWGAQDNQPSNSVYQWMYGFDAHYHRQDLVLRAEFVQGRAKGASEGALPCDAAPCLTFKGAYGLAGYRVTNIVMPYVRVDWRDALHRDGASFVYISKVWRATGGIRLALNENLTIKAEYNVNKELGRLMPINNNVFTSSLVVKF